MLNFVSVCSLFRLVLFKSNRLPTHLLERMIKYSFLKFQSVICYWQAFVSSTVGHNNLYTHTHTAHP
jgi:hypothetical protein